MHFRELSLTTNTARLAELALKRCEIRVRGKKEAPIHVRDLCENPKVFPVLLYPSEQAEVLSLERIDSIRSQDRDLVLIVPDGNWRQGAKAARRTAGLEGVRPFKLPPGPLSEYRLRSEPRPECVSTYEAVARALGILEGPGVETKLMEFFRMKVDRTLWARGLLPTERVRGGVPQAAIDAFTVAGSKGKKA